MIWGRTANLTWVLCLLIASGLLSACSKRAKQEPQQSGGVSSIAVLDASAPIGSTVAALQRCKEDGSNCTLLKPPTALPAGGLMRTARGARAAFGISSVHVTLGEDTDLVMGAHDAANLTLKKGSLLLRREASDARDKEQASGPKIEVRVLDRTISIEPSGRLSLTLEAREPGKASVSVEQGWIKVLKQGSNPLELRAGENMVLRTGQSFEPRTLTASTLSRPEFALLKAEGNVAPRGLGTLTARVPGTTETVAGVRLVKHHVRAAIRDGFARTEIEEEFQNDTNRVLEGRYVFPLPPDASISRLALWVGDTPVEAEMVERKLAARIFNQIVEDTVRPRDPALLEWVSGSEFSLKIFPIPAKGRRKILIAYNQALPTLDGNARYVYPLSLGQDRSTRIDDFSLQVIASDTQSALREVRTPGYAANIKSDVQRAQVQFTARDFVPRQDFALTYTLGPREAAQLSAYVPTWGEFSGDGLGRAAATDTGYFAVRLTPELSASRAPDRSPHERVFVLDASVSQSAETWLGMKKLVLDVIRYLDPADQIAVLACNVSCSAFPERGLSVASDLALREAEIWLEKARTQGASDLSGALLAAESRLSGKLPAQIVYVGDGMPTAGELSAERIAVRIGPRFAARSLDVRLLGAGRSVDEVVLKELARRLSGSYEPALTSGALMLQSAEIAAGLRSPLITEPKLELPAGMTDVEPAVLPNLRLGQELVLVGKLQTTQEGQIRLRGKLDGKPFEMERAIRWTQDSRRQNPLVPRLWAEARINRLEASGATNVNQEIVSISKRYHVMSRLTSLLALENDRMFAEFSIPRTAREASERSDDQFRADSGDDDLAAAPPLEKGKLEAAPADLAFEAGRAAEGAASGPLPIAPPSPAPAARAKPSSGGGSPGGLGSLGSTGSGSTAGARADSIGMRAVVTVSLVGSQGAAVENAARVIAGMRAGFRACAQRALAADPGASSGTVRFRVSVAPTGDVTDVSVLNATVSPSIVSCTQARTRAAHFSPPDGGQAILVIAAQFSSEKIEERPSMPPNPSWQSFVRPTPRTVIAHSQGDEKWQSGGEEVLSKLRGALESSPRLRSSWSNLVRGLLVRGRFEQARTEARKFVEQDPDHAAARELLAYADAILGAKSDAAFGMSAVVELEAQNAKAQLRAARALEALGDEHGACAHFRAHAELEPTNDEAQFEALRCRARTLSERDAVLSEARALTKPGKQVAGLIPFLEAGNVPPYDISRSEPADFTVKVSCERSASSCPSPLVLTPLGTVISPWTPGSARAALNALGFRGLRDGVYRTLLVGGVPDVRGEAEIRAQGTPRKARFERGGLQTINATTVSHRLF